MHSGCIKSYCSTLHCVETIPIHIVSTCINKKCHILAFHTIVEYHMSSSNQTVWELISAHAPRHLWRVSTRLSTWDLPWPLGKKDRLRSRIEGLNYLFHQMATQLLPFLSIQNMWLPNVATCAMVKTPCIGSCHPIPNRDPYNNW